jgi:hypothetical protein
MDDCDPTETLTQPDAPSALERVREPTIGRYRIVRLLGQGGMGLVYEALDPDLERRVALKVLRCGVRAAPRARLVREARAMARLAHPNVVSVHEVASASECDFVAMELVDGDTLAAWLRTRPAPAAIVDAFVAAGRGLAAAHAAGIVHRDFKPHNVLRSTTGRVLVTDFGLAREPCELRARRRPGPRVTSSLLPLTSAGRLLGTPGYMAPEQWSGGLIGPATDQFAFCVGLWEALAGVRPFETAELRANTAATPRGTVPRRYRAALLRGLAIAPADRWPSMSALLARLERRGRRRAIELAALGVVATLAIASFTRAEAERAPASSRRHLTATPDVVTALALVAEAPMVDEARRGEVARTASALAAREGVDPCARSLALVAQVAGARPLATGRALLESAATAADRCGDDNVAARVAIVAARYELEAQPGLGTRAEAARQRALAAIERSPSLRVEGELIESEAAARRGQLDLALALAERAVAASDDERARLDSGEWRLELRFARARPSDVRALRAELPSWRALASALGSHDIVARLDDMAAFMHLMTGDVAAGHAAMLARWHAWHRVPIAATRPIAGEVVDRAGHPFAGASVYVASNLTVDPIGAVPLDPNDLQVVTTDDRGRFALDSAPLRGAVIAEAAGERSAPAFATPHLHLVVGPTRTISGRIELGDQSPTDVFATVESPELGMAYQVFAPIAADGTFAIAGAPTGAVEVTAVAGLNGERKTDADRLALPASPAAITGVQLRFAPPGRRLHVIARSALTVPLETAQVIVTSRPLAAHSVADLLLSRAPRTRAYATAPGSDVSPELARQLQPGDLVADFDNAAPDASACVVAMTAELTDGGRPMVYSHAPELAMHCVPVPRDASVVVVETAPQPRVR